MRSINEKEKRRVNYLFVKENRDALMPDDGLCPKCGRRVSKKGWVFNNSVSSKFAVCKACHTFYKENKLL